MPEEGDQGQQGAGQADSGREWRGGDAVELRPAVEAGNPALAAEIERHFDVILAVRPVVAGVRVEQQVIGGGDGVEQFEFDVLVVGREQAGQQVVGAEGAVGEAEQGGAALLDAGRGLVFAIDRHVHQEARLGVLLVFLDQGDAPGQGGLAAVARACHGQAAYRLGKHVVAEGLQVAPGERFDVDDARILRTLAGRGDGVVGKAFGADGALVRGLVAAVDHPREAGALNAGQGLVQLQLGYVVTPFGTADFIACREQGGGAAQHLGMGGHPEQDLAALLLGTVEKALLDLLLRLVVDKPGQRHAGEQNGRGDQPAGAFAGRGLAWVSLPRRMAGGRAFRVFHRGVSGGVSGKHSIVGTAVVGEFRPVPAARFRFPSSAGAGFPRRPGGRETRPGRGRPAGCARRY